MPRGRRTSWLPCTGRCAPRPVAQLRPPMCPEGALISVFNCSARGSAPPESASSAGEQPPGDCNSGAWRSSWTYDGAPGLWQCTPVDCQSRGLPESTGSSFCIQSPCMQECTAGVRKLGRGTAAGRPRPRGPAAVHRGRELSSGRRGAPRRLFFLYSIAVPEPRKC